MMSAENAIQVKAGRETYTVSRFRGLKAQLIMRLSAKVGRAYPKLATKVAEFEQSYIAENMLRLSRPEAELRFGVEAAEITDEAWQSADGELALKQMPSPMERLAHIWPELLEAAEEPLFDLIAVVSLSNEDLAKADDADGVEGTVEERRRLLLHDAEFEQLIELALAGYEVARGQFGPLVQRLTPLLGMLGMTMGAPEPTESSTSPESEAPTESSPDSSDSETRQPSSTDSQPPTDGLDEKPSTTSPGPPSDSSQGS